MPDPTSCKIGASSPQKVSEVVEQKARGSDFAGCRKSPRRMHFADLKSCTRYGVSSPQKVSNAARGSDFAGCRKGPRRNEWSRRGVSEK